MPASPARRLLTALDLHDAGVEMRRARLRREHPTADEAELRARLRAWLHATETDLDPCFSVRPWRGPQE